MIAGLTRMTNAARPPRIEDHRKLLDQTQNFDDGEIYALAMRSRGPNFIISRNFERLRARSVLALVQLCARERAFQRIRASLDVG